MPVYRVEGVVLRRVDLGEADRLVTLYTREQGKLSAVARGARKPTSRLGGRIEPYTHLRALLAAGRRLDILTQVEVVESFSPLRTNLKRMAYAAYVVELLNRATAEREPHPELFRLLLSTLTLMRNEDCELTALRFALRLLALQGYRPSLSRCVGCGRPVESPLWFSITLGGVLCARCSHRDPSGLRAEALKAEGLSPSGRSLEARAMEPAVLQSMERLLRVSGRNLGLVEVDAVTRGKIWRFLQEYIEVQLETHLQSLRVIHRLESEMLKMENGDMERK